MSQGTKLTSEQIGLVTESLLVSPSWRAAADHAGVNEKTLYDYRKRAESYTNRFPDLPDENDPDHYFWRAVTIWTEARSTLELRLVQHVLDAAPKDWKAAHAMLKSGWPQDYSDRVELTGAGGGPVQIEQMKSEALERAEAALEQLGLRAQGDESAEPAPAGNDEETAQT